LPKFFKIRKRQDEIANKIKKLDLVVSLIDLILICKKYMEVVEMDLEL